MVLKPSEVAPLNAFALAEVIDEVGLPPGVFNLVTGPGAIVGEAIASHPQVDMVSFTGSTRAGKRVMELAAGSGEAGGPGARAASRPTSSWRTPTSTPPSRAGVFACYINSGQTCSALTRMIVPRSRLAEVEEKAAAAAAGYPPGDAFDAGTMLGPLVSAAQRERVRGYIQKGIDEGAKLVTGGPEAPEGLDKGYFVRPTVFSEVTSDMTIAQEEIFGPVLVDPPLRHRGGGGADRQRHRLRPGRRRVVGGPGHAERVARRLRTGQVDINGGAFNPSAPFGGYRQSGIGRERGRLRPRGVPGGQVAPALSARRPLLELGERVGGVEAVLQQPAAVRHQRRGVVPGPPGPLRRAVAHHRGHRHHGRRRHRGSSPRWRRRRTARTISAAASRSSSRTTATRPHGTIEVCTVNAVDRPGLPSTPCTGWSPKARTGKVSGTR